ncbi:DUF2798 domain-containing protein [Pseudomonas viridiflava]|uniref:DUF2798 domain-containing protein n=2 Tax=Pseudomonas TaxID=286 RepID=UPI0013CEE569|nr:DUF2798 domain-containing protein [Pseudomonas viridiflava]
MKSSRPSIRAILPPLVLLPSIALLLSFVMTWATLGIGPDFMTRWGRSFLSTLIVLPFVLAFLGLLEKAVDKVVGDIGEIAKKLIASMVTACFIETIIACAVTAVSHPFDSAFAGNWWLVFSRSLPVGLLISLFMCFYMKPKIDRMRHAAQAGALADPA